MATNIGRGTAVLFQFYLLFRVGDRVRILREQVSINLRIMWQLVRLSGTGTFQVFVGTASWIGLIRILSAFGSDVLAGYTIGIRVIIFAILPSWGMSNAAATMVGQALGANKPERAERAVWIAGFYNMVFLGVIGLLFMVLAPQIVALFTSEPDPARYGVMCLRIVSAGFLFYAYGMVPRSRSTVPVTPGLRPSSIYAVSGYLSFRSRMCSLTRSGSKPGACSSP